ncbi:hypothetical protein LTR96_011025 [Exophiala xenobiotica]|nr:hypothetical protein LTR92_011006 [Exophiala xenobiotica]KAK5215990.1 hypothetical protein LTR72_010964 [Exophiala xenobiotica]KAK5263594.1 hypothetical protein LTR96_011025 [Exophiala xenobiotica]KAK5285343.1 hypothetical protein LTR14_011036 [Exophiala xenobiotica]KAK5313412.1 hypothetical protein LTR93_010925 [Exophiala xenobiotica]
MPVTQFAVQDPYGYNIGFASYQETTAVPGALPIGSNSPQKPPYGLYAEKLSGTAFTAPRDRNLQSWLYRIIPSASHADFEPYSVPSKGQDLQGATSSAYKFIPDQLRFDPFDIEESSDFLTGRRFLSGCGGPSTKTGIAISMFSAGTSMPSKQAFYSADGDLLVVLQHGVMHVRTELGRLLVRPNEILVIPRGIRYRVDLGSEAIRGYTLELYEGHFQLPELGPIGSNGLANARDFQIPVAAYEEDTESKWSIVCQFNEQLFITHQEHSPFDVVAWHGLYYPFKYDLGRFNVIGSTSFDHPDPSIYTVLTAPSNTPGVAIADFVIFPPRWLVQEDTFRPPWYHRNTMAEFMGLICGDYDAKSGGGFKPAGASLHNVMSSHGPDSETHHKASNDKLKPRKIGTGSMAFMFETSLMLGVTDWALTWSRKRQAGYQEHSWQPLKSHFTVPEHLRTHDK